LYDIHKKHTNAFCGQNEKFQMLHLYAAHNKAKELVFMPLVYRSSVTFYVHQHYGGL